MLIFRPAKRTKDIRTASNGKHGIEWVEEDHGTRVTIELEARYQRGTGSVDEYLEQTAIANPHVCLHYMDPEDNQRDYDRSAEELPAESQRRSSRIRTASNWAGSRDAEGHQGPHAVAVSDDDVFARQPDHRAAHLQAKPTEHPRANDPNWPARSRFAVSGDSRDKDPNPATDCICPIGEELILKGLHHVVPGEFYAAATRPPGVYRGNPFQIEVGLAYGGEVATQNGVSKDLLTELLEETDARTVAAVLDQHLQRIGQ